MLSAAHLQDIDEAYGTFEVPWKLHHITSLFHGVTGTLVFPALASSSAGSYNKFLQARGPLWTDLSQALVQVAVEAENGDDLHRPDRDLPLCESSRGAAAADPVRLSRLICGSLKDGSSGCR